MSGFGKDQEMNEIKQLDKNYIAGTYGRFDLQITEGMGSLAYDENGREYIDLGTGIAVNTFGYCDLKWVNDVTAQLTKLQHTSNLYYTEPQARLAEMLCHKTGMKKVFFGNSGAEANECAIKVARKYSSDKYGEESGRNLIVTLKNGFLGRTVTTLSATGQDVFHHHFAPFTPGFLYTPANDIEKMKEALSTEGVCAVFLELVQGEGGVVPMEKAFVEETAAIAKEKDILLVIDEVQTGNGRTGKLYCYMNYDITPDLFTTAKGLAGGLPLGACVLGEKVENTYGKGDHGSTFGGNPVCAAGALSILSRLDDACFAGVRERSDYIINELTGAPGVKSVTGMGLMLGIEPENKKAGEVAAECIRRGVLVLTAKEKVRLLPALNIPMNELEKGILILKEVLAK